MRILDRYINTSIITTFFLAVLMFCLLFIIIDATSHLDEFIDRRVPIAIIAEYYISFFPIILVQSSSLCCLIAVLFTFSGLHNNNEIIAMRASGLNFWQVTRPALIFGIFISIFVFWMSEQFVPLATERTKKIKTENMEVQEDKQRKNRRAVSNLTFYGLKNRLYFIDKFDPNTDELFGITIIEYDNDQNIQQKIVALKGKWTQITWKFFQVQVTTFSEDGFEKPIKIKVFQEKLMDIKETPEDFFKQRINVNAMNLRELYDYIKRFSSSGAKKAIQNLRVDFHQKIAAPFANFIIILIGLPFAMMVKGRKGMTFTSFGIAIAIGFLFYVTNAVMIALGKSGVLPPILAGWAAPIIFAGIAVALIEKQY